MPASKAATGKLFAPYGDDANFTGAFSVTVAGAIPATIETYDVPMIAGRVAST